MLRKDWSRKAVIISIFIVLSAAKTESLQAKTKLSCPELTWAISHPFIAIKVKRISKRVLAITDSIEKTGLLKDRSGGQLDAFKHSMWMALLAQEIKVKKANKLGLAHEKFNYRQARKGKGGGDKAASDMDLWNNKVGQAIGFNNKSLSEDSLIMLVVNEINAGEMQIVKKDILGNSLDSNGQLIDKSTLKTWLNKRCLVASNYQFN